MSEFPKSWSSPKLGEVVSYKKGKKPNDLFEENSNRKLVPYLDIQALEKGIIRNYAEPNSVNLLDEKSIAIVWDGARSGWVSKGVIGGLGSTIAALTPNNFEVDYLYHFLKSKFEYLNSNTRGTGIPHVDPQILWDIEIPLPPLPEQKRIVAKLDNLFAHLDQLKARLQNIPTLLKQFRQAVLTQAVTGKLTEEWREGETVDWVQSILNDVCDSITDGDHQAPPQVSDGIPFLVISNVNDGKLNLQKVTRYVTNEYYQNLKDSRKPRLNDVLYTVTGSIGIPVIVDTNEPFTFQRHIAILKPNKEKVLPRFLYTFLKTDNAFLQGKSVATGTAQITIPLSGLREYTIPLPSLAEQEEIVRRVESLFAVADRIEASYTKLQEKIDHLPQAILSKAFRGELVE